jgi:hypothetical protein
LAVAQLQSAAAGLLLMLLVLALLQLRFAALQQQGQALVLAVAAAQSPAAVPEQVCQLVHQRVGVPLPLVLLLRALQLESHA